MELTATQKDFLETNHNAVCTTFRRNGAAQLSIVTSGLYGGRRRLHDDGRSRQAPQP